MLAPTRCPFGNRSTAGVLPSRCARGTRHGWVDWGRLSIVRYQYVAAAVTNRRLRKCRSGSGYGQWQRRTGRIFLDPRARPVIFFMDPRLMKWVRAIPRLFDSEHGASDRLAPRWLFLRALGGIYFSAFFSLVFQIRGLIGPDGILPANEYLAAVVHSLGYSRGIWFAPTLLWFSSSSHALTILCWVGMGASLLLVLNIWPRGMLGICFVCFLSFVSAAQDFSGYQSDGMLLEAGFVALFFAPRGFRPRHGGHRRHRALVCSCCNGNGFASISNLGLRRSPGETPNGATLRLWMSTTKTARCPPGLAGTSNICRTGSMLLLSLPHLPWNWFWYGRYFSRAVGASSASLL